MSLQEENKKEVPMNKGLEVVLPEGYREEDIPKLVARGYRKIVAVEDQDLVYMYIPPEPEADKRKK